MKTRILVASLLAISGLTSACGSHEAPPKKNEALKPVAVKTVDVQREQWSRSYEATGTVRARTVTPIAARLMSYVTAVRVKEGDRVAEGQVLVTLDPRDQDTVVSRAAAMKDEVTSGIAEATASANAAKANVDLAQTTHRRMSELHAKRSVTDQELDEASARLKSAQGAYDAAQSRLKQLSARMAQVEQEVRMSALQRGYTTVSAPFAGTIVTRSAEPGMLALPGVPLFTLERADGFRLEANVEETRLAALRPGTMVEVRLGDSEEVVSGKISEIVPSVDAASRSGIVKIDLPQLKDLRTGSFGRATFAMESSGKRDALTIPANAVMERGQLQSVYVAEGGFARLRLITLGATRDGRVEVLSGLNGGEKLIVPPFGAIADGTPLGVRE
ncbi:RND transporter [Bryobacterales bacterium F-183]|nr:RND transporter [Bryobacterales bacterium F-183]